MILRTRYLSVFLLAIAFAVIAVAQTEPAGAVSAEIQDVRELLENSKIPFEVAMSRAAKVLSTTNSHRPYPFNELIKLNQEIMTKTLAQPQAWNPGAGWKAWYDQARQFFLWSGRSEYLSNLIKKIPASARAADPSWDGQLALDECEYLKMNGKIGDCLGMLEGLSAKWPKDASRLWFDLRFAQLLTEDGQSKRALDIITPYTKENLPAGERIWVRLVFSSVYLNAGKLEEAKKYLNMHRRELSAVDYRQHINPIVASMYRLNAMQLAQQKQQRAQVTKEGEELLTEFKKAFSVATSIEAMARLELVLSAVQNKDKSALEKQAAAMRAILKQLPDYGFYENYLKAAEAVMAGKKSSQFLPPIQAKVGPKNPTYLQFQKMLAVKR